MQIKRRHQLANHQVVFLSTWQQNLTVCSGTKNSRCTESMRGQTEWESGGWHGEQSTDNPMTGQKRTPDLSAHGPLSYNTGAKFYTANQSKSTKFIRPCVFHG